MLTLNIFEVVSKVVDDNSEIIEKQKQKHVWFNEQLHHHDSVYHIKVSVTVQGVGMFMRLFEKSYKV